MKKVFVVGARRAVLGGAIALGLVLGTSVAVGQGVAGAPKAAAKGGKIDAKEANDALKSSDSARIESALVNIRAAGKDGGGRAFTAAIVGRLKIGLPKELVRKALDALAELEDPTSTEAGEMYLEHRDGEVRLSAVRVLGAAKTPAAVKGLRLALGDGDPRVRGLAATLLGATKAADAVPDLVAALDKGINEAAVSIGQLCDSKSCDALLDRLKNKPFDVISTGLQQELLRKDVSDDVKKKVITAVRELASQKAREFLVEVKGAWPKDGSKAILDALDKAIKDLEGASK